MPERLGERARLIREEVTEEMLQDLAAWFRSYRSVWMLGPVVWGLLAVAGALQAPYVGQPALRPSGPALLAKGYALALVVFGLDLLVRALFGLGWEPFFLG